MQDTIDLQKTVTKPLGLGGSDGVWHFGKVRGFPVGLQMIPGSHLLLLFQIRHDFTEEAAKAKSVQYDREIAALIENKKVEVDFDNRLAWLSFIDASDLLQRGAIPELVNQVLGAFAAAGLSERADQCFSCQKQRGNSVTMVDDKVAAVCADCVQMSPQSAPAAGQANPSVRRNRELMPLVLGTLLGVVVSAIAWALCWAMIYWVERIPIVLSSIGIAVVCGGPVGWLIRRIHGRGRPLMVMAVIGTTLGIVLGEVLYLTWLIYREAGVIDPVFAMKLLPDFQADLEGIGVVMKLACVVIANAIAIGMVSPEKGKQLPVG